MMFMQKQSIEVQILQSALSDTYIDFKSCNELE